MSGKPILTVEGIWWEYDGVLYFVLLIPIKTSEMELAQEAMHYLLNQRDYPVLRGTRGSDGTIRIIAPVGVLPPESRTIPDVPGSQVPMFLTPPAADPAETEETPPEH